MYDTRMLGDAFLKKKKEMQDTANVNVNANDFCFLMK